MNEDRRAGRRQPPEFDIDDTAPSHLAWLLQAVAWDGALPFVAIVVALIVRVAFPPPAVAGATILTAAFIAIVRVEFGRRRLVNEFGCCPPQHRQIMFAGAIVALFAFDLFGGALAQGRPNGAPPALWLATVILYFAYLACILAALRPSRRERTHSEG